MTIDDHGELVGACSIDDGRTDGTNGLVMEKQLLVRLNNNIPNVTGRKILIQRLMCNEKFSILKGVL